MAQRKSSNPIAVGNSVFIRTVTMYYTGKIAEILPDVLVLENAAWIADVGRFSAALASGVLNEVEPYHAAVAVSRSGIIDVTRWPHPLPREVR